MPRTVLARRVGVAQNTIYRFEAGLRTPSIPMLERIARELRTDPAEFMRKPAAPLGARPADPEEAAFLRRLNGATVSEMLRERERWFDAEAAAQQRKEAYIEAHGGLPKERDALLQKTRELERDPEFRRLEEDVFYATRRIIWITNELRRRPGQTALTIEWHTPGELPRVRWFVPEEEREPYREKLDIECPEGYTQEDVSEAAVHAEVIARL